MAQTHSFAVDCGGTYDPDNALEASQNQQALKCDAVVAPRTRIEILLWLQKKKNFFFWMSNALDMLRSHLHHCMPAGPWCCRHLHTCRWLPGGQGKWHCSQRFTAMLHLVMLLRYWMRWTYSVTSNGGEYLVVLDPPVELHSKQRLPMLLLHAKSHVIQAPAPSTLVGCSYTLTWLAYLKALAEVMELAAALACDFEWALNRKIRCTLYRIGI